MKASVWVAVVAAVSVAVAAGSAAAAVGRLQFWP